MILNGIDTFFDRSKLSGNFYTVLIWQAAEQGAWRSACKDVETQSISQTTSKRVLSTEQSFAVLGVSLRKVCKNHKENWFRKHGISCWVLTVFICASDSLKCQVMDSSHKFK